MKAMLFQEDDRYTYALGQLRARETRLFAKDSLIRWLDERLETVLRALAEGGYDVSQQPGSWEDFDFDGMLERRRSQEIQGLAELLHDTKILSVLEAPRQLRSLRTLLRGRVGKLSFETLPLPREIASREEAKAFVEGEHVSVDAFPLGESLYQGMEVWEEKHSLYAMDQVLEEIALARRLEDAKHEAIPFLLELVRQDLDFANLLRLLRASGDPSLERGKTLFLPGGFLDADTLFAVLEDESTNLGTRFAMSPYGAALGEGLQPWQQGKGLGLLERCFDDHRMATLRQARLAPFGPEIAIAWHGAIETECLNLRNLFVGRVNELPHDEVAQRMRESYV